MTTRQLKNRSNTFVFTKEKLEKKVTVAEQQRSSKRGPKSWYDLRTLKKLKLVMKDELSKK